MPVIITTHTDKSSGAKTTEISKDGISVFINCELTEMQEIQLSATCSSIIEVENFLKSNSLEYQLVMGGAGDARPAGTIDMEEEHLKPSSKKEANKFWQTIREHQEASRSCFSTLSGSNLELATKIHRQSGCDSLDDVQRATQTLKDMNFVPIGWAGGNLRERGDFFAAGKGYIEFLDDPGSYLGMVYVNLLLGPRPPDASTVKDYPIIGKAISEECEIAFFLDLVEKNLCVYFKSMDASTQIGRCDIPLSNFPDKFIRNIRDKIKGSGDSETTISIRLRAALNDLDDDDKNQIAIELNNAITSNGGISYIADWTGLYVARHIKQAVTYAGPLIDTKQLPRSPEDPVIHRIFIPKEDVEKHFKILQSHPLNSTEALMYIHKLQTESSSPDSIRGVYGRDSSEGDLETGDYTEMIIVGQGIPEKVLCLPLSKSFTKKLIMTDQSLTPTYSVVAAQDEIDYLQLDSSYPLHELYPEATGVYLEKDRGILSIREQELGLGAAKKTSFNQNPEDIVMRLVMRNPSKEVIDSLHTMHEKLKELLVPLINFDNNSSLEWLLEQTNEDARGGFKNVESLISYLNKPSNSMPTSELITKTATIITSLAYCWLDCGEPTTEEHRDAQDRENIAKHGRLLSALEPIINGHIVPHIGLVYPGRGDKKDIVETTLGSADAGPTGEAITEPTGEIIHGMRRQLSTASVLDEEEAKPAKPSTAGRSMYIREMGYGSHGGETWPQKAKKACLPIRNHISSGLPLDLAVCEGLLGIPSDRHWSPENRNRMRKLATAMYLTHYARADYHSWPETQAAIEYFTELRSETFFRLFAEERTTSSPQSIIESVVAKHHFPRAWDPSDLMVQAEMDLPFVVDNLSIRAKILEKIDAGKERRAQLISTQEAIDGVGIALESTLEQNQQKPNTDPLSAT